MDARRSAGITSTDDLICCASRNGRDLPGTSTWAEITVSHGSGRFQVVSDSSGGFLGRVARWLPVWWGGIMCWCS